MPIKIVTMCRSVRPDNHTVRALCLAPDEFGKHRDLQVNPS
jgi:hypothetical protein